MFERILVPLDGSRRAEQILAECGPILRCPSSRVILLRVADTPLHPSAGMASEQVRRVQLAEAYVDRLEKHLQEHRIDAKSLVREGNAADCILRMAEAENATLILMSTHGRTGPSRWIFGSVAESVLRGSKVPVLVYRAFPERGVFDALEGMDVKRILLPVEESGASLGAVPFVARLAVAFGARVQVVHVLDKESARAPARRHVEEAVRRLREADVPVESAEREGDPAKEILAASRDLGADLIAMTTHGHSGAKRWMFGSVAENVLRSAEIPVFIVRPESGTPVEETESHSTSKTI